MRPSNSDVPFQILELTSKLSLNITQLSTRNRYPDNAEEHSSYEEQSTCKDPSLQDSNGTDEEPSFSPELRLPQRDNRANRGSDDIHW